uniref:Cytoplasmic dynein 2 light intermediate chain 1 n=1 Tax=Biomphalaria glabrata TaxID=6526 RepID=A0A2C9KJ07_BIOGL
MDKSLWDLAIEQNEIKKDENFSSEESTVIVMGSKSSGKTSIILRFLDRDEPPKPTVALEYTFGRRSKGHNIVSDLWYSVTCEAILKCISDVLLQQTTLILVLDLATPTELWNTMETLLQVARSRLNEAIKEAKATDPQIENKLRKQTWERIGEEHPDKNLMNPFLIPLAIVGSKYDIFQDFDSDKRKTICKTLRFLAHIHGASLQFFSTKQEQLVSRMKGVLSFYLFDTTVSKTIQVDHNKPIFVSAGQDALQQIGTPPLNDGDVGKVQARNPMELWKMAYTSHFPQTYVNNPSTVDDPAKDPQFAEPAIDTLRAQKQEELERYRKLAERRSKGTYDNDYVAA